MRENIPTKLLAWSLTAPDTELDAVLELIEKMEAARGGHGAPGVMRPTCARFVFQRLGQVWRVVYDGAEAFYIEDTLGARYLNHLLHHPNEPISAFDLEIAIKPEKARARNRQSLQFGLDGDTVRAYLRELERLRAERERAEEAGDCGQAQQLEEDIAAIEAALKSSGQSEDPGERARDNVRKALAAVGKRLGRGGKAEKAFAEHLTDALSLGYNCLYIQPKGAVWE